MSDPISETRLIWHEGNFDDAIQQLRDAATADAEAAILAAQLGAFVDQVDKGWAALRRDDLDEARRFVAQANQSPVLEDWPYPLLVELEEAIEEPSEPAPCSPTPEVEDGPRVEGDEIHYARERVLRQLERTLSVEEVEEEIQTLYEAIDLSLQHDSQGRSIQDRLAQALERRQRQHEEGVTEELEKGKEYEADGDYTQAKKHYMRAQAMLEETPGKPKPGVRRQFYENISGRVTWARMVETLPQKREEIEDLIQQQAYDEAVQQCQEVLRVIRDKEIEQEFETLCQEIEATVDRERIISDLLGRAREAREQRDYARASTLLEQAQKKYPDSPEIAAVLQGVRASREEAQGQINDLLRTAEAAMAAKEFAEAEQKYEAVLELDNRNMPALAEVGQARENAALLQEIETKVTEAIEELGRHGVHRAETLCEQAEHLDTHQWRKAELDQLRRALEQAQKDLLDYRDTLVVEFEHSNNVRWPDDMDEWTRMYRRSLPGPETAELVGQIDGYRMKFLRRHYTLLSSELNAAEQLAGQGKLHECLAKLRPVQQQWEPILYDPVRRAAWPNVPLFDAVESRVEDTLERLKAYEPALRLLQELDDAVQFAEQALQAGNGYIPAIDRVRACLAKRPSEDETILDVLRSRYDALERLAEELSNAWESRRSADSSKYLNQAEVDIMLEEYTKARESLENIELDDLTPDGRERWRELFQAAGENARVDQWLQEAEVAWQAGQWVQARESFERVIERAESAHRQTESPVHDRRHRAAQRRLEILDEVREVDGQVQRVLRQTTLTPHHVELIDDRFEQVLALDPDNDYLVGEHRAWEQTKEDWLQRQELKRQVLAYLQQRDWKAASQALEELPSDTDPDLVDLRQRIRDTEEAAPRLTEANALWDKGFEANELDQAILNFKQAHILYNLVDSLNMKDEIGAQARVRANRLEVWLRDLEQAAEYAIAAEDAGRLREYENAYEAMHQACNLASFHPVIRERFERERDEFENLTLHQQPFLEQVEAASELIDAGDLNRAAAALRRARDHLDQAPTGEGSKLLEETKGRLVSRILADLETAWQERRFEQVQDLVNLDEEYCAHPEIREYDRRNRRRRVSSRLDRSLKAASLEEARGALTELERLTDAAQEDERAELRRWQRRTEAVQEVQRANIVAEHPQVSPNELVGAIESLRQALQDDWFESERLDSMICFLEFRQAVERAKEWEATGEYEKAAIQYGLATRLDPSAEDVDEARKRILTTLDLHQKAQAAFEKHDLVTAAKCLGMVPEENRNWFRMVELQRRVLDRLESQADTEQVSGNYGEALRYYDYVRLLDAEDMRYHELCQLVSVKLNDLRARADRTLASQDIQPHELTDLMSELEQALRRWGLDSTHADWIDDVLDRLRILHQSVQRDARIAEWLQEAEESWQAGDWPAAREGFQRVLEHAAPEEHTQRRKEAERRLGNLEQLRDLDARIRFLTEKTSYVQHEVAEIYDLFEQALNLEPDNGHFGEARRQFQRDKQRCEGLVLQAWRDLSRGDWEAADQALKELTSESDAVPEIADLRQRIKEVGEAAVRLERANELVGNGRETNDPQQAIIYLERAYTLFEQVESLNLRNETGAEAKVMADKSEIWIKDFEQAMEFKSEADKAAGQHEYERAHEAMNQACAFAYINSSVQGCWREQRERGRPSWFRKLLGRLQAGGK